MSSLIAAGIALCLLSLACSRPEAPAPAAGYAGNSPLLVAAAADLAGIQQPLADSFEKATGRKANIVFGSSGLLARQIEQGAPYDVYLSANEGYVQSLVSAGKLDPRTVRVYALGRLGLWSRRGEVKDLRELAGRRITRIAIANPAHAPYGVAARQALQKAGLWNELQGKIVYGENVRQALQYAESGNADVALTAWSLVFDRGGVLVPDNLHAPIRQTAAVVRASARPALAASFLEFLTGRAGGRILQTHGFTLPRAESARAVGQAGRIVLHCFKFFAGREGVVGWLQAPDYWLLGPGVGCGSAALRGSLVSCCRLSIGPDPVGTQMAAVGNRLATAAQDFILPHTASIIASTSDRTHCASLRARVPWGGLCRTPP